MAYTTLISAHDAQKHINDDQWLFIDCRYYLQHPQQGREEFLQAHLPGALYAHLDNDLSSPVIPGVTGRHPLPDVAVLSELFSSWGVDESIQVVVYDQGPGMIAARLWWMLRWLGHENVAVMDGGWKRWQEQARPMTSQIANTSLKSFVVKLHNEYIANAEDVLQNIGNPLAKLFDARDEDRFRGENEILDPVAGHIVGAISAPYANNIGADGCFISYVEIQDLYKNLLSDTHAGNAIVYCGSGVTAALDILAMMHAGLGISRLYVGSWSHWITDETRPIA